MSKSYKVVFVSDLETDMVIGQDVFNEQGNILVPKGFTINSVYKIKNLLMSNSIQMVKIMEENEIEEDKTPDPVFKYVHNYAQKCEDIKDTFEKMVTGKNIQEEELNSKVEDTLTELNSNINIFQLMQKVKSMDDATFSHSHNVSLISYSIGQWLDLKDELLKELALSALLIDIGKIMVPKEILNKKGKVTEEEFEILKRHSTFSHQLIEKYSFINKRIENGILFHHERWDGSGYPMGLKGENIPLFARIIAVADVYNAITSKRPHRDKKTPFEAIKIMENNFLDKLDINILYTFLNKIGGLFIGQAIRLNNNKTGEIIFIPKRNIHRPVIKLDKDDTILDLNESKNKSLYIVDFI
ncbi:HD-GYP domain-containing protein [Clostridiisalibacter paucivorans]|uniref:HD-GYP domain-containing protein n=1 Tax=Clostridiisalibacter paucivorans TaxID=408753 RepID=UPI000685C23B|nr:HD-GYP domain-containing protein [Clostridiisalibacter paucivorans]